MVGCWMTGLERPADIREEEDDIIPAGYFSFSPASSWLLIVFLSFKMQGVQLTKCFSFWGSFIFPFKWNENKWRRKLRLTSLFLGFPMKMGWTLLHFCSELLEWVHHNSSRAFTFDRKFWESLVQIPACDLLCHFGGIFPLLRACPPKPMWRLLANVAWCSCRRVTAIFHPQLRLVHSFAPFPKLVSCRSTDACATPEARDGLLRV